jgi:molybdenum cofactor cytidylyltransferase
MNVAAIILAAGASTRMGRSKQLLPVNGRPLLLHTLDVAEQAGLMPVVTVLGAHHQEHQHIINTSKNLIAINPQWQSGMGSSLKVGLNHALSLSPSTDAAIMLVCDQPELTVSHLHALVDQYQRSGRAIVASYYADTTGVPALFDKTMFPELLGLDDTQGAQKLVRQYPGKLAVVNFPGGAIDLDTPEDYDRFITTKKPSR